MILSGSWVMTMSDPCLYADDPWHEDLDVCYICAPRLTLFRWELSYRWDRIWRWLKGVR